MRICMIWDADYPWDVRVEKVATAFVAHGHTVALVARNRARRPVREALAEGDVFRLRPYRWLTGGLDGLLMFPAFFNPRWLRRILDVARATRADVLLCRDLPLAPAAVWAARRLRVPVVLDMAENYPAMLKARWTAGRMGPLDVLVRNPRLARVVENWVLPRVDGILVVVEESGNRLRAKGIPEQRLAIVGNTPALERLHRPQGRREEAGSQLRIVYLGLLELPRGIGTLIEAVARLRRTGVEARLTVIGGGADAGLLQSRALALGCTTDDVKFLGRLDNPDALRLLSDQHVGVVPHWRNESWNTTIPNKLFDYMAAGLAVVTSDAEPAARIVRETGSGLVFQDRNVDDLAAVLAKLADVELRRRLAEGGRRAVAERYNWGFDGARMVAFVEGIAARRGTGDGDG